MSACARSLALLMLNTRRSAPRGVLPTTTIRSPNIPKPSSGTVTSICRWVFTVTFEFSRGPSAMPKTVGCSEGQAAVLDTKGNAPGFLIDSTERSTSSCGQYR